MISNKLVRRDSGYKSEKHKRQSKTFRLCQNIEPNLKRTDPFTFGIGQKPSAGRNYNAVISISRINEVISGLEQQ